MAKGTRFTISLIVEAVHDGGPEPRDWDDAADAVRRYMERKIVQTPNGGLLDLRAVLIDSPDDEDGDE